MTSSSHHKRGQSLLLVTLAAGLIFGSLALAVDVGWAYFRRETEQATADSAALAAVRAAVHTSSGGFTCGSSGVWCSATATNCPSTTPTTASNSFNNACMMAAANGLSGETVSLTANTTSSVPTVSGPTAAYWATARAYHTATSWFGGLIGTNSLTASVRATAAAISGSGGGGCIYVLDPSAPNAFLAGNDFQAKFGCGVYVNSTANAATASGAAMEVTGSAYITAPSINVVGSYHQDNNGGTSVTPSTGTSAVTDPLVSLPSPTAAPSCQSGNFTSWQSSQYTPAPGTYCGFSLGNGMNAQLSGGTYIINGGTFSIQGGSTLTTTGGVMIYLTGGATMNIANGATVTLTAQTSGSYQGILFYQDRSVTSPGSSTIAGGANLNLTGSLYFPHALLNINNGTSTNISSAGTTTAIVADTVDFQGGASVFTADTNGSKTGITGASYTVYLIE
jgi:Putative Flp pilus-assembly TadE/G-like